MKLNREEIKIRLNDYFESVDERESILEDEEIQGYFREGNEIKARELIAVRYPNGDVGIQNARAIILIEAMLRKVEFDEDIKPIELYRQKDIFHRMINLAKAV